MKRFGHKFTLPLILTALVLAIACLFIGFLNLKKQTTLPSNSNTSAIGIELNQEFDYIDLHQLQDNGISFVYLRSTQGRSYFDDNFLSYRDQIQGTNLAFGSEIYFSNESTARQQYEFFIKKVGLNTGSLPIMLQPVTDNLSKSYLKSMAKLVRLFQNCQKKVMVAVSYHYHSYFPANTKFLTDGKKEPNKINYSFWRYTTKGRVKGVAGLDNNVTMYSYNGSVAQYKQRYGQLTQ